MKTIGIVHENFLLYALSDDWSPFEIFDGPARRFMGDGYSRGRVIEVIEELVECGYIELGDLTGPGGRWAKWDIPLDQAIKRITQQGDASSIESSSVFWANLTPKGHRRLAELGDPYETYGDPWYDDPYISVQDLGVSPYKGDGGEPEI